MNKNKQFVFLLLTLITVVAGYAYLRYAYKVSDSTPFTQEIVLIILGTVATIFITAMLLNQQTAVEIEKEQNIKFLNLKAQTYEKLLGLIEEMSLASNFTDKEITKLQFITHRLAIFSSPEVLSEYQNFLKVVADTAKDSSFGGDSEIISNALGKLTIQIRADLLNEHISRVKYTSEQIRRIIAKNALNSST
ncbi:hypothetical protein B6D60_09650, partial [candidate division KSB1 bacterium 4484_87]